MKGPILVTAPIPAHRVPVRRNFTGEDVVWGPAVATDGRLFHLSRPSPTRQHQRRKDNDDVKRVDSSDGLKADSSRTGPPNDNVCDDGTNGRRSRSRRRKKKKLKINS